MTDTTRPDPTQLMPGDTAGHPALVVVEDERSWRVALPVDGLVIIGRGAECELVLHDPAASRKHAQLRIARGRAIVSDLGSYNGTTVNGEVVVGERELRGGDAIGICNTVLVFHGGDRRSESTPVLDDATFHQRLTAELDRGRRYRRPVTVVAIRFGDGARRDAGCSSVAAAVRPLDTVATDGTSGLLALLPELAGDQVAPALAAIAGALGGRGARLGWAGFPGDGIDAATLLASARAAATAAGDDGVVGAASLARTLELGGARIVVAEPTTVRAFALIERIAASALPVLILGETGVGKESAAQAVHYHARRPGPFKAINCAAIPDTLVESELFGHDKGAFSGALTHRAGLFEAAAGGTVFLDEVGELTLAAQAKLLRVLDARTILRVGSTTERVVDVRVVAATNRDLRAEIAAGRFREDLFYRLSGATVSLPPLRKRPRELPLLIRGFATAAMQRLGREPVEVSSAAMVVLAGYRWPGNIRELRNALDFAAAACDGDEIEVWHLPPSIAGELAPGAEPTSAASASASESARPTADRFRPLAEELRALERKRMAQALRASGGVQTRAAELLHMPRRTFVAKMREYGLHDELGR